MKNIPEIDTRDYKMLMKDFKKLAANYVPEWKFEEESDDFGVALAKVFCEIQEETINRMNKMVNNYYISFLNIIGTRLYPAKSAYGFAAVEATADSSGAYIKKESNISGESPDSEDDVDFETAEDLFVVDSSLKGILFLDALEGSITKVFDLDDGKNVEGLYFRMFDNSMFKNLQKRELYIREDNLFNTSSTDLTFYFKNKYSTEKEHRLTKRFSEGVVWQYFDKEGKWTEIEDIKTTEDGGINLVFKGGTEKSKFMNEESLFLRCLPGGVDDIEVTEIECAPAPKKLSPEKLYFNQEKLDFEENGNILPFNERFLEHDCFYIESDEAFTKKGSLIEIFFDLKFIKIKTEIKETVKKYKLIMSDLDFSDIEPADVYIKRVVWEYWNGKGWAKLKCSNENGFLLSERIFMAEKRDESKISFICPDNLGKVTVGAEEGFFIRARITKINNRFDTIVNHITPQIDSVSINCSYGEKKSEFNEVFVYSKTESKKIVLDGKTAFLFREFSEKRPAMYLCFSKPLSGGVIRIFFDIEGGIKKNKCSFKWEYWSETIIGGGEWKFLNTIDYTENFFHSGTIILFGKKDFKERELFGMKGYFIKITDTNGMIRNTPREAKPVIRDIKLNVVKVIQRKSYEPEFFGVGRDEKNKICKLSRQSASKVSVWVNEVNNFSVGEYERLLEKGEEFIKTEKDSYGKIKKAWVKWNSVSDLYVAGPDDRVYEIDFVNSKITFGDGIHGRIPCEQFDDSIMVSFSSCVGLKGNIKKDSLKSFSSAIPGISRVYNFKSFVGGLNAETIETASKRMFSHICGGERIISALDFEQMILLNDSSVSKVKCAAHMDRFSNKKTGELSIAVLPKDFPCGFERFSGIQNRIFEIIEKKASATFLGNMGINVFEADYVEISINVGAVIKGYDFYQEVYTKIESKLKDFLNPVKGNFNSKGWKIGSVPNENIIRNCLKNVGNMKWIRNITLFAKMADKTENGDISFEDLEKRKFIVPVFGKANIELSVI
jgi:hypothetical protein